MTLDLNDTAELFFVLDKLPSSFINRISDFRKIALITLIKKVCRAMKGSPKNLAMKCFVFL